VQTPVTTAQPMFDIACGGRPSAGSTSGRSSGVLSDHDTALPASSTGHRDWGQVLFYQQILRWVILTSVGLRFRPEDPCPERVASSDHES